MANVYETCYYGGMIVAILLLVVTIILFFVLKIPRVLGELTGSSARKEVKSLKAKGTKKSSTGSNEPKHYSQRTGAIRTRTTDTPSGELSKENTTGGLVRGKDKKKRSYHLDENQTEFLGENKITAAVTGDIAETAVLSQNDVEAENLEFVNTDNLKSEKSEEVEAVATAVDDVEKDVSIDKEEIVSDMENKTDNSTESKDQDSDDDDEATEVLSEAADDDDDDDAEVLSEADDDDEATEVLSAADDDDEATEVLSAADDDDEATEVLSVDDDEATEVLSSEPDDDAATEVLTSDVDDEEATAVLTSDDVVGEYGETSVLSVSETKIKPKNYIVLYNAMEVHTSEKL